MGEFSQRVNVGTLFSERGLLDVEGVCVSPPVPSLYKGREALFWERPDLYFLSLALR